MYLAGLEFNWNGSGSALNTKNPCRVVLAPFGFPVSPAVGFLYQGLLLEDLVMAKCVIPILTRNRLPVLALNGRHEHSTKSERADVEGPQALQVSPVKSKITNSNKQPSQASLEVVHASRCESSISWHIEALCSGRRGVWDFNAYCLGFVSRSRGLLAVASEKFKAVQVQQFWDDWRGVSVLVNIGTWT